MKRILLHPLDVVSIESSESFGCTPTSKVAELVKSLLRGYRLAYKNLSVNDLCNLSDILVEKWLIEGVEAEVLQLEKGWKTGKLRISIEFIPDEEEEEVEVEVSNEASPQKALPPSPLDDLRQKVQDLSDQ